MLIRDTSVNGLKTRGTLLGSVAVGTDGGMVWVSLRAPQGTRTALLTVPEAVNLAEWLKRQIAVADAAVLPYARG